MPSHCLNQWWSSLWTYICVTRMGQQAFILTNAGHFCSRMYTPLGLDELSRNVLRNFMRYRRPFWMTSFGPQKVTKSIDGPNSCRMHIFLWSASWLLMEFHRKCYGIWEPGDDQLRSLICTEPVLKHRVFICFAVMKSPPEFLGDSI